MHSPDQKTLRPATVARVGVLLASVSILVWAFCLRADAGPVTASSAYYHDLAACRQLRENTAGAHAWLGVDAVLVLRMPQRVAYVDQTLLPQLRCLFPDGPRVEVLNATDASGVDVAALSLANRYAFEFGRSHHMELFAPANAACFASHMRALDRAVSLGPGARTLVLEDDADLTDLLPPSRLASDIQRALAHAGDAGPLHLLRLGDCSAGGARVTPVAGGPVLRCMGRCFGGGSAAYVVSTEGAALLLAARERHLVHYDWFQGLVQHYSADRMVMYCVRGLEVRGAPVPSLNGPATDCPKCDVPTAREPAFLGPLPRWLWFWP